MYKNIIFDLGGVVVDFKPRDFLMDHDFVPGTPWRVYRNGIHGRNKSFVKIYAAVE